MKYQALSVGFFEELRKKALSSWKPEADWNAAIQVWKPRCLARLVRLGIIVDVELLEIMLGAAGGMIPVGPRDLQRKHTVRFFEDHLEGLLINHFELGRLAGCLPVALAGDRHTLVGEDRIVPEFHVGGGVGMSVGPLHALAQADGIDGGVRIAFEGFRHIQRHAGPIRRIAQKRLIGLIAEQHGKRAAADQGQLPVASIFSNTFHRLDDQGLAGSLSLSGEAHRLPPCPLRGQLPCNRRLEPAAPAKSKRPKSRPETHDVSA